MTPPGSAGQPQPTLGDDASLDFIGPAGDDSHERVPKQLFHLADRRSVSPLPTRGRRDPRISSAAWPSRSCNSLANTFAMAAS